MLNSRKVMLTALLAIVMAFVITACSQIDPIEKADQLLSENKTEQVVNYYNQYVEKIDSEARETIDGMIAEHMEHLLLVWDESDDSYEQAKSQLENLVDIANEELSTSANDKLAFIEREHSGNEMLAEAEAAYKEENYLGAMKYLETADKDYSQYKLFNVLYNDSKLMLLDKIGHPSTVAEYETAIKTLDSYLQEVDDADFQKAQTSLQKELDEYKDIYNILLSSTDYYEKGQYKDSFDTLTKGLEKYPKNNKIEYALSSYQYAFLVTICSQVIDYIDNKEYDLAEELLTESIAIYDCDEFQELQKNVRMKTDVLFALKTRFSQTGDYIFRSSKKMVLGDYAEDEQETLLSLGGSIAASLLNVDAPLDVRDLAYDVQHWGEGDYFAARLALDAVGIVPLIGALKYIKHLDTAADVAKGVDKAADAIDTAHDVAKAADTASDLVKNADSIIDTADIISDVKKKTTIIADLTDDFSDYAKKADVIDDITDSVKKANKADAVADTIKKTDTATDVAETAVKHYEPIKTLNQALEGLRHPETGVEFVRRNLDLSDGRRLTGVFPKFDSLADIELPDELLKAPFPKQQAYLIETLQEQANTPAGRKLLEKTFSAEQIEDILQGILPEGLTWHHNEVEGLMQLVDSAIHTATNHTGGMSIWGIGY